VDSLCLPDPGEEVGLRPGQRHARVAALGRWGPPVQNAKLDELRSSVKWAGNGDAS